MRWQELQAVQRWAAEMPEWTCQSTQRRKCRPVFTHARTCTTITVEWERSYRRKHLGDNWGRFLTTYDTTGLLVTHPTASDHWRNSQHLHTYKHFTALFPGPPGWTDARRELLDFMVQGKINRGRHTDHPPGRHSIRTKQCPPPPSPHFLQAGCPSCRPTNSVKAQKAASAFGLGRRR